MTANRQKPTSVVLDMLRSARSRQRTARSLVSAGELFGYTPNTMRVTLSRLMARGLIDSPERGLYRLTSQTDALNQFVERWRLGEDRVRPWDNDTWLFAHLQGDPAKSVWALNALGFREVRPALFARPDNLQQSLRELRSLALSIGMDEAVLLVRGQPDVTPTQWRSVWRPQELNDTYTNALARLTASEKDLANMSLDDARLACFTLGGEMIHHLAKDPLLPDNWVNVADRHALWQATLRYDTLGKEIWAAGKEETLHHMPRPQLMQENT